MKNTLRNSNFSFKNRIMRVALLRSEPRKLNRSFGGLRLSLTLVLTVGWMGAAQAQVPFSNASYTFSTNGNVASFAYNGSPVANLTIGNIVKSSGITTGSSSGNFRASGWTTNSSLDASDYIGFTLATAPGQSLNLTSFNFGVGRSGTGTRAWAWYFSTNGFTNSAILTNYTSLAAGLTNTAGVLSHADDNSSWTNNVLSLSSLTNLTNAEFRLYSWSSEANSGTAGLQGPFAFSGSIVSTGGGTTPTIITTGTLTPFSATAGTASAAQTFAVTGSNLTAGVTVTAPGGFEVSQNGTDYASGQTLIQSGGTLDSKTISVRIAAVAAQGSPSGNVTLASTGATTANVAVSGTVTAAGAPSVTVSPTSATGLTNYVGQVSASTNYTVTGTNLVSNLVVTASTNAIEVSTNSATGFTNSFSLTPSGDGTLTNTVYVRISASAPVGAVSGTVSNVSGSASNNFTISGTVTQPALTLVLSPTTIQESAGTGASTGTVGIPFSLTNNLTVSLVSSNTAAATVPPTVTITNGQTNATFAIAVVANTNSYTNETAVITASQASYTSASATLTVQNVDAAPASTISLTSLASNSYTQSFDALGTASIPSAISFVVGAQTSLAAATGSSTLNGWYATKAGGDGTTPTAITPGTGTVSSGSVYSYGAASAPDRALGVLASDSNIMAIGALIKNDTGGAIDGIKVSFTAEFWRSSTSTQNVLTCAIGKVNGGTITTANFLTAASATPFISGNITGPAAVTTSAPLNGNDAANQSTFTDVVIPLVLAPGETGFVRWSDVNDGGNDAGLAIDNLRMTAVVNSVPTPEFSLTGGIYLSDQNLKVSNFGAYAPGTTVYYTVDGSTPTSGSTVYNDTTGIALTVGNGPIVVKVIAIQGGLESFITSATYDLPKDVANLAALRASATGSTIYRVTGPVTFTAGTTFRKTKFFQDSGAGIQIDDFGGIITTAYLAGDNVRNIVGKIALFNGQLQMVPLQDFGPAVSSGNVVTPLSRTLATLTDADQARLVTIPGVEYQGANGTLVFTTPTATINTAVRDSSTGATYSGWVRNIFSDSDVTGKVIPTGSVTVTGIVQKTLINSVQSLTVGPRSSSEAGVPAALRLSWSVDLQIPENGAFFDPEFQYLTLSRVGNSSGDLQVLISCNPESRLSLQNGGVLPQTITIPAGTISTQVKLMPVDNSNYTGDTLVTITATAANHTEATASATILEDETLKTTPTISPAPTASPITAGQNLSTSILTGGSASVEGTFAWTTPSTVPAVGTATYGVTFTPTDTANYNTATTTVSLTVNPAGTTYSGWLNGAGASDAAFLDYVFGAATPGTLDPSLKPTVAVVPPAGGAGGDTATLVLTYYVRQNTVGLTVTPKTSADLAAGSSGWTTVSDDEAVGSPTTRGDGVTVQMRKASVPMIGDRKFLRVEAVQR